MCSNTRGPAIVPSDLKESPVWQRIRDDEMPPTMSLNVEDMEPDMERMTGDQRTMFRMMISHIGTQKNEIDALRLRNRALRKKYNKLAVRMGGDGCSPAGAVQPAATYNPLMSVPSIGVFSSKKVSNSLSSCISSFSTFERKFSP